MRASSPQYPYPTSTVVQPKALYDQNTLRCYFDLNTTAIRNMRRQGLPVRRVGRKNFIYGQDIIDHVLAKCPLVGPDGKLVKTGNTVGA
ncbi:hypothetical protein Pan181_29260 [Aeoliella mucimassa]|uniref:Uncharacterized protein n=1 Tax=Aeoliella mucimassa TaxID=2527972 RepID=A0A518APR9_9BACT|nr:hypothetical protein Pan181_29260 [Aeoliella mucimassa]